MKFAPNQVSVIYEDESTEIFKITTNILKMVIYWGAFQIACSCLYIAWHCNKEPSSIIPSKVISKLFNIFAKICLFSDFYN